MKKKTKYIMIAVVILSVIVGAILMWKKMEKETKENNDPKFCVERKLGIELGEGVTLVEGKAYDDEYGEERIEAKFKVKKNELESLKEKLGQCLYEKGMNQKEYEAKHYINNVKKELMDLAEKTIVKYYEQGREGKVFKTIWINSFIATDDTGEYYFYISY